MWQRRWVQGQGAVAWMLLPRHHLHHHQQQQQQQQQQQHNQGETVDCLLACAVRVLQASSPACAPHTTRPFGVWHHSACCSVPLEHDNTTSRMSVVLGCDTPCCVP